MAHIESRGFGLPIYGESLYTKNLRNCYNDDNAERIDSKSVKVPVMIKPNGDVIRQYGKIGEIGYADIESYQTFYGNADHTTFCRVYTHTGELFGAYLSLTLTQHTASKVLAKDLPNHELPKVEKKQGLLARLFGK